MAKVNENQKVENQEMVKQVEEPAVKPAEEEQDVISDELFKAALKKKAKRLVRDTVIFTGGVLVGALALSIIGCKHKDEEVTETKKDTDVTDVDFVED